MNRIPAIILSGFFQMLIGNIALSQNYIAFPDSGIIWRQISVRVDPATFTQICWDNQFELKGIDTVINGLNYSRLYYTGTSGANGVCDIYSSVDQNNWAIREDSAKKIYIYDYLAGQEYLLYDFNLNINDTLPFGNAYSFHGSYDNYVEVISGIDLVLIDGVYRKAYNITSTNWMGVVVDYVQIIEGIGSTFGLFANISPNWGEKYDFLSCVYINGQVVYFQSQPCTLLTSAENIEVSVLDQQSLKLYPNPAVDNITIESPRGNLTISSADGKVVYSQLLSNGFFNLNLNGWASGIYFISVITSDRVIMSKMVVE